MANFNVTLGVAINKDDGRKFSDFGYVYSDLPYDQLVALEGILAKHSETIFKAYQPVIQELLDAGYQMAGIQPGQFSAPKGNDRQNNERR